jgi:hypothetical protein
MTGKYVVCCLAFLSVIWFGVLSLPVHGQSVEQSAQEAIEKALSQKGTFEFAEIRLGKFVALLRQQYGINVAVDYRAISEKGIDPDSPIAIELKDVTVRSALELAIRPLGLNWTIYCEALVISTPAGIQSMQFSKVYDITGSVTVAGEQGKTWEDPEALVQLITAAVSPESWDSAGGRGTIQLVSSGAARLLVVTHNYRAQRQIARLLTDMQEAVKQHAAPKGARDEVQQPRGEGRGPRGREPVFPGPRQ